MTSRGGEPPVVTRLLSHEKARDFYDRLGARQDWQRLFENPALRDMVRHAAFPDARAVIEFGCGTGRLAADLLDHHLQPTATYLGLDASPVMIGLARRRVARFGARAEVRLTDGNPTCDAAAGPCDRFVSTYVLDLLSEDDILAVISSARRLLRPGGLVALVSLTHGGTAAARVVERAWMAVHSRSPWLVGGCRPLSLETYVCGPDWTVRHRARITVSGITSEVLVAATTARLS
jgi:SAM-dependent methyltransferase